MWNFEMTRTKPNNDNMPTHLKIIGVEGVEEGGEYTYFIKKQRKDKLRKYWRQALNFHPNDGEQQRHLLAWERSFSVDSGIFLWVLILNYDQRRHSERTPSLKNKWTHRWNLPHPFHHSQLMKEMVVSVGRLGWQSTVCVEFLSGVLVIKREGLH